MATTNRQSNPLWCRGCGKPLAKMEAGEVHVRTYYRGVPTEVVVKVQHSGNGVVSIGCEKCAGLITPHYFVTLRHPTYIQSKAV